MPISPQNWPRMAVHPPCNAVAGSPRPLLPRRLLLCLCALFISASTGRAAGLANPVSLNFFDVGQGDALLIHQPGRCAVLIDAGPPGSGKAIGQHLAGRGISGLNRLVISHPHRDHFGGVLSLPTGLAIGEVNDNGVVNTPEGQFAAYLDWRAAYPYRPLHKGDAWRCGDVLFTVLGADLSHGTPPSINDASLVLRLEAGPVHLLLPGDLEAPDLKDLSGRAEQLDVEILKVPHHGAENRHMKEWLEIINPELSVISVGRDNPIGAPDLKTLETIRRKGGRIWRTDTQGALEIRITEKGWRCVRP